MLEELLRKEIEKIIHFLFRHSIVPPASKWSHAVPAYMPWTHQNDPAHFMRFQGGRMPVPGPILVPGIPNALVELYVHPRDPCSSRAAPTTSEVFCTRERKLGTPDRATDLREVLRLDGSYRQRSYVFNPVFPRNIFHEQLFQ